MRESLHRSEMYITLRGDFTTAKTVVIVGQGFQQGNIGKKFQSGVKAHPKETNVRREFADIRGWRKVSLGQLYDFSDPCWRVRYPDGDWEELNRQDIKRGGMTWRQLRPELVVGEWPS